jgi:hypothetical protein
VASDAPDEHYLGVWVREGGGGREAVGVAVSVEEGEGLLGPVDLGCGG